MIVLQEFKKQSGHPNQVGRKQYEKDPDTLCPGLLTTRLGCLD